LQEAFVLANRNSTLIINQNSTKRYRFLVSNFDLAFSNIKKNRLNSEAAFD